MHHALALLMMELRASRWPPCGTIPDIQVILFQIVLASGKIINAKASKYADLHKFLKGGNNNFGIVDRFDCKTFEQGSGED